MVQLGSVVEWVGVVWSGVGGCGDGVGWVGGVGGCGVMMVWGGWVWCGVGVGRDVSECGGMWRGGVGRDGVHINVVGLVSELLSRHLDCSELLRRGALHDDAVGLQAGNNGPEHQNAGLHVQCSDLFAPSGRLHQLQCLLKQIAPVLLLLRQVGGEDGLLSQYLLEDGNVQLGCRVGY